MTARADAGRERAAIRLGLVAATSAALAFALVARDAAGRRVDVIDGPVAPAWSEMFPEVRTLHVVSAERELTLVREEGGWTLVERAGYPVDPSALARLDRSLADMRFSGARTSDPANHERLGVADPAEGGEGVRLTASDENDAPVLDLIFGAERPGGAFIRRPEEMQTYAAQGEIPDLDAPSFWLDLDFLGIARVDVASVEITPREGQAFRLERGAPAASDFVLADPSEGWELITAGAANGPGSAAAELRFLDVRARSSLAEPPAGRHTTHTFDGLSVTLSVYRDGGDEWATIDAVARADAASEAAERAEALQARTSGWAYKLPEYAADRLIRPLTGIARRKDPS